MIKRVFMLIGDTLSLYEWKGDTLLGVHSFEFNESGFALFKSTLHQLPVCPAQLLVSMSNEDFYREKVPHVRKRERSFVVKRYIKKHFGDEKYTHVLFQEREKEGRKDDVVLISSIGNSEEFDTWLSLIHEMKVPLIGIWSVPLFFNTILESYFPKNENVIFLNKEACGNYRQSLFVNGSLILSRVTDNIESSMGVNEKVSVINEFIEQLYKFSTNKRILSFDSQLSVLCFFDEDVMKGVSSASTLKNLQYRMIDFNFSSFSRKTYSSLDENLSLLCTRFHKKPPHYTNDGDRSTFSLFKKNNKLYQFLAFFSFLMLASSGAIAIKSLDRYRYSHFNDNTSNFLEREYEQRYHEVDLYLDYAIDAKALVDEIAKKQLDVKRMPTDLFYELSEVLSMPLFSDIITNHILWKRYSGFELESIEKLFKKEAEIQQDFDPDFMPEDKSNAELVYVHITGDYFVNSLTYDEAIETMNRLHEAFKGISSVAAVHMLRIPVDLRVDSRFEDYSGILASKKNKENDLSAFEFILEYTNE